MDAMAVSALLETGFEMDEATTAAAFWSMADIVDGAKADGWTRLPYPPFSTRPSRWTRR